MGRENYTLQMYNDYDNWHMQRVFEYMGMERCKM